MYDKAVSTRLKGMLMALLFRFSSLYRRNSFQNLSLWLRFPLKILGGVPQRVPPPFTGGFAVIVMGFGFGSSGGSSGGSAKSGARFCSGCLGKSVSIVTAVSMWSARVSCASLKLCCVVVDSPLDEEDDLSGLKPKLMWGMVRVDGFWTCVVLGNCGDQICSRAR